MHKCFAYFDNSHRKIVLSLHDDMKNEDSERYLETDEGVFEICDKGEELETKSRLQFLFTSPEDHSLRIRLAIINACHAAIAVKIKVSSNEIFIVETPVVIVPRIRNQENRILSQIQLRDNTKIPVNEDHFMRIYAHRLSDNNERDAKSFWSAFKGTPDYIWTVKFDFQKGYTETGSKEYDNHCALSTPGCSFWTLKDCE